MIRAGAISAAVFFGVLLSVPVSTSVDASAGEARADADAPVYEGRPLRHWLGQFDSRDPTERWRALHALGAFAPYEPAAVEALGKELRAGARPLANVGWLRTVAAQISVLGPAARPAMPDLITALDHGVPEAAAALAGIGKEAIAALLRTVEDDKVGITRRAGAAEALGLMGPAADAATGSLLKLLDHPAQLVQVAGALALARVAPEGEVARRGPPVFAKALGGEPLMLPALDGLLALKSRARPAIPELIKLLDHPPTWMYKEDRVGPRPVRDCAVEAAGRVLAAIGADAVPALVEALKGGTANQRANAAYILGQMGPAAKSAAPALAEMVLSGDRAQALQARWLLDCVDPKHEQRIEKPRLLAMLKDPDPASARWAGQALADQYGMEAFDTLVEMLLGKDEGLWILAAGALQRVGPRAMDRLVGRIEALRGEPGKAERVRLLRAVYASPQAQGEAAVPFLVRLLEHPDAEARDAALWCLPHFGRKAAAAVPALIRLLPSEGLNGKTIGEILVALSAVQTAEQARTAVPQLIDAARNQKWPFQPIEVIGCFGPNAAAAVPYLQEALKDPALRDGAARVLARIGPAAEPAVPALLKIAERDDCTTTRYAALDALAHIGKQPDKVVPLLVANLDAAPERMLPLLALFGPDAAPAVPEVLRWLQHADWHRVISGQANAGTGGGTGGRPVPLLAAIGPGASEAVPMLLKMLEGRDHDQLSVVKTLGAIGPAAGAAREPLARFLEAQYAPNAAAVIDALVKIGPPEKVVPVIVAARHGQEFKEKALLEIGRPAIPAMLESLAEPYGGRASWQIVTVLGAMGPDAKAAAPALGKYLRELSNPPQVRQLAIESLGKIAPEAVPEFARGRPALRAAPTPRSERFNR